MKKKIVLPLLLCGILALGVCAGTPFFAKKAQANAADYPIEFDENNIALTFTNFSDAHVGFQSNEQSLLRALRTSKTLTKNKIDALQFCGDNTQDGKREQAVLFRETLESEFDLTETAAVITHGNHDTYWSGCMTTKQFAEAYGEKVYTFDQPDTDYTTGNRHVVVKGYHFLSVQIASYTGKDFVNPVSRETETWLRGMLDKLVAENPNQYIFVSSHSPAKDTCYGSSAEFKDGPWGASKELAAILDGYKQVILFSGHTHYAINDERNITQTTYTQIQSGSLSDSVVDVDDYVESHVPDRRSESQGMLCEVDTQGRMRIMRYDFRRNMQIKNYWYLDACKADGSHINRYTEVARNRSNKPPVFGERAKLVVDELPTGAQITYSAATDDDMVYSYTIGVYKDGKTVTEVKSYSPFYITPNLSNLSEERKLNLDYTVAYPYTVKIVAHDSFDASSKPLSVEMRDTTEEDMAAAAAIDARVAALNSTPAETDGEEIKAIRAQITAMSFKSKGYLKKLADFEKIEARYYNSFHLTADAEDYAPNADDMFSTATTASKGWAQNSEYTGVSLNWNAATLNNSLGFNRTFELDGLHISLANLSLTSESKLYGVIISNKHKEKWAKGSSFLLGIDFEYGDVFANETLIAQSDCLKYSALGAAPFDLSFTIDDDGTLKLSVKTFSNSDTVDIAKEHLSGLANLTDLSACYVSFSTWERRTTGSFDVAAIHGGKENCEQYASENPPENPEEPEKPSNGDNGKKKGCGSVAAAGGALFGTLSLGLALAVCLIKKRGVENR